MRSGTMDVGARTLVGMDRQAFDFGLCFAICANWSSNHHCRKKPSSIITCSTLRGQKRERSHIVVVRCHQTCACCGAGHSLALALHSKSCVHRVCCHVAMDGTCALLCVLSPSAFSAHGHADTIRSHPDSLLGRTFVFSDGKQVLAWLKNALWSSQVGPDPVCLVQCVAASSHSLCHSSCPCSASGRSSWVVSQC